MMPGLSKYVRRYKFHPSLRSLFIRLDTSAHTGQSNVDHSMITLIFYWSFNVYEWIKHTTCEDGLLLKYSTISTPGEIQQKLLQNI